MNMVRFHVKNIIFIVILGLIENHDCKDSYINTAARSACIKKIKTHFRAYDQNSPSRKFYIKKAFLYMRVSDDPALNTIQDDDVEAYYKKIRQFITIGSLSKSPTAFCIQKHFTAVGELPRFVDTRHLDLSIPIEEVIDVYTKCEVQMLRSSIPLLDDLLEVLYTIYDNVVFAEIDSAFVCAKEYVEYAASCFGVDDISAVMQLPRDFCHERYSDASRLHTFGT